MNRFEAAIKADKVLSAMSPESVEYKNGVEAIVEVTNSITEAYDSVSGARTSDNIPTGLLYGRIQSGKTRNMVLTAAKALDGKFKVVIVLTSNNNDLVQQTYDDFKNGLPGVKVISKAELVGEPDDEIELLKTFLPSEAGAVVIVCSKGSSVLEKVIKFLVDVDAKEFPTLIFDDEGDQATINTSVRKRSTGDDTAQPSKIFTLIHSSEFDSLRNAVPSSVIVSVTGTPQALLLQNRDSESSPSFIKLIKPGRGYVGGDDFFNNVNPETNKYIQIVDEEEGAELLDEAQGIPDGLSEAIKFFIVAATSAGLTEGWKQYNMLAHPSLNRFDHSLVRKKITSYINLLIKALSDESDTAYASTVAELQSVYDEIADRKPTKTMPPFSEILNAIKSTLPQRQVFVINSDRKGPTQSYSLSYNFLIGGNSIGRGIAIKNLLVTYYTRSPKTGRMDTMHQHARMFGYREDGLQYTKVFLPPTLYSRFYGINKSDNQVREYIDLHGDDVKSMLVPTNKILGLKPTRDNVLDLRTVNIITPGSQLYPEKPIFEPPRATTIKNKVEKTLNKLAPGYRTNDALKNGLVISTEDALKIVDSIKTHPSTSWTDAQIRDCLIFLGDQYDKKVLLRYRDAPNRKNTRRDGSMPSGVIGSPEQAQARQLDMPTLWIFLVKGSKEALGWGGVDFIYPTLVTPLRDESLFGNIS